MFAEYRPQYIRDMKFEWVVWAAFMWQYNDSFNTNEMRFFASKKSACKNN